MASSSQALGSLPARLWRGEVPVAIAFWRYGLVYGTLLNVLATIVALGLVAAGAPLALWLVVHFLPIHYNLLVVVGVWRARDSVAWAQAAIAVWGLFVTFA